MWVASDEGVVREEELRFRKLAAESLLKRRRDPSESGGTDLHDRWGSTVKQDMTKGLRLPHAAERARLGLLRGLRA
jgi:hypothetical protein